MKVLLDKNFPLSLLRALRAEAIETDHIITLGCRGISDSRIQARLREESLLFLTHDADFLVPDVRCAAVIVVSRVKQSRPIGDRVAVWCSAIRDLIQTPRPEKVFELSDEGRLTPWTAPAVE